MLSEGSTSEEDHVLALGSIPSRRETESSVEMGHAKYTDMGCSSSGRDTPKQKHNWKLPLCVKVTQGGQVALRRKL